jgi:intracellular sulfur oxidation DsrE/DsrF family protein
VTRPETAGAPNALENETEAIRQVLERYRQASNALAASAIQKVWPELNREALARAFKRLDEQDVSFQSCRISVNTPEASAVCSGTVRYVPSVGSRSLRVEQREWTFRLGRQSNGWLIERVEAR